jgi:hypothetical protein
LERLDDMQEALDQFRAGQSLDEALRDILDGD